MTATFHSPTILTKQLLMNRVIIACAGGRKTTRLVEEALKIVDEPVLITTYTLENLDQIYTYIIDRKGCVPANITLISWYKFLLRDCIRPYQNQVFSEIDRVETVDFVSNRPRGLKKTDYRYYFNKSSGVYQDGASDYACKCNEKTNGLVIDRIERIYKHIFIDEAQDLAGWDLELIKALMNSQANMFMVADPRQATYSTNRSNKNKGKKGRNFPEWVEEQVETGLCLKEEISVSHRSNQQICTFADLLYPSYSKTTSENKEITGHDGVYAVAVSQLPRYLEIYKPIGLRYSKVTKTHGHEAVNIGLSKGRTYLRILIFPTKPMKKFLFTGNISEAGKLSTLYVAITRAKHSVTFVLEDNETTQIDTKLISLYEFT